MFFPLNFSKKKFISFKHSTKWLSLVYKINNFNNSVINSPNNIFLLWICNSVIKLKTVTLEKISFLKMLELYSCTP